MWYCRNIFYCILDSALWHCAVENFKFRRCFSFRENMFFVCINFLQTHEQVNPLEKKEEATSIAIYLICITVQLFTPCYFASLLTHCSHELHGSIFHSKWWQQTKEFKVAMGIFLERAQRPIEPRAGAMFYVGLPIFVKVYLGKSKMKIIYWY